MRHPEVIDLMLEAGAVSNFFGVETTNQQVGKSVGRGLSFDDTLEVFGKFKAKSPDYWIRAFFIIGLPNETRASLLASIDWVKTQRVVNTIHAEVLDIEPYGEDLQQLADFAAFATNPAKYGFLDLRFEPDYYWRHATLDMYEAYELHALWQNAMAGNPYITPTATLTYMDLMMLGVEQPRICASIKESGRSEHKEKSALFIADYFRRLQQESYA